MPDITREFVGLTLRTPFLVGSGPNTTSIGQVHRNTVRLAANDWAGVVGKTVTSKYGEQLRTHIWSNPRTRFKAMQNAGPAMNICNAETLHNLERDTAACHREGLVFIGSIMGYDLDEWAQMASSMEAAGCDAIELNLSCPSPRQSITDSMGGLRVGQSPELTVEIIQAIKSRGIQIPIIAKLPGVNYDIAEMARRARQAGAAAVTTVNTQQGIIGVDLNTEQVMSSNVYGGGYISGISGPYLKPFALAASAAAARTGIAVSGVGGIVSATDAIEFLLLGASTVQVCTGVMWYGFKLGTRMKKGLLEFMERNGYESVEEFYGKALRKLTQGEMPAAYPDGTSIRINDRCNKCGLCVTACNDGAFYAISWVDSAIHVDTDKCTYCGLCATVCAPQAIKITAGSIAGRTAR